MTFEVHVNNSKAKLALERAMSLEGALSSLLGLVIAQFQRQVRSNLTGQGSEYGGWEGASKWTIAKKGTSKLFLGEEDRVRIRNAPGRAEVIFDSPGEWTLSMHEKGFTKPGTGERVDLDLKMPSALGISRTKFSFISKRPQHTPARRMWPTDEKAHKTAEPIVQQWAKKLEESIVQ